MDDFIRRVKELQEVMQRLGEGPMRSFRGNETAIARVQELVRGVDWSVLKSASHLASLLPALADSTAVAFAALTTPEYRNKMDHYLHEQRQTYQAIERLALPHKEWSAHFERMSSYIEATRLTLPTIDFGRIGGLIAAANTQGNLLARLTGKLVSRHAGLIGSFGQRKSLLASLPPSVADLPTLDLFVHTTAVRSITPHEPLKDTEGERAVPQRETIDTETALYLERTLPELKHAFLVQYRGIRARATDCGPDGWTQGSASMRKLLKGVLHTAAPDELVLPWATKNNKELDAKRHPTRATKVAWLCQFISNKAYRAYVQTELESALALINLLDTAQHVDEFPEFEEQYNLIMLRLEIVIRHILALWKLIR